MKSGCASGFAESHAEWQANMDGISAMFKAFCERDRFAESLGRSTAKAKFGDQLDRIRAEIRALRDDR